MPATVKMVVFTDCILSKKNTSNLRDIIYRNFSCISDIPKLNHTKREINRLLKSENSILILGLHDNKITCYLLAESVVIGQRVLIHIYYMYTAKIFRKNGLGTEMLNMLQEISSRKNIHSISLTYDTYDRNLTRFYTNNGFVQDMQLNSNGRYNMLVKCI